MISEVMLTRLRLSLGCRVAVDYRVNNGEIFYIKGVLFAVDELTGKILIKDDNNDELYLDFSEVLNMKVKDNGGKA